MATLRPHKQLPLLPLVSMSPRRPRAPATLSGGNSLRTPSFCRPLPRHPAPYPPPRPDSAHSRPRAPRRARRGARLGALAENPGPQASHSPQEQHSCPTPFPSGCSEVSTAPGTQPRARWPRQRAGSGWGTVCLGFSFPLLWAASGASSRFCGPSLSPDPECRLGARRKI